MTRNITEAELIEWARILTDYSLGGIKPDDVVMIVGERVAWPLMNAVERRVLEAGAVADILMVPPDNDRGRVWGATMAKYGTVAQAERVPSWWHDRFNGMTKFVEIMGAEMPHLHNGLPSDMMQTVATVHKPFLDIRVKKPWVLTLFPTQAFADMDKLELDHYTEVVVKASLANPDPLRQTGLQMAELMRKTKNVSIFTNDRRYSEFVLKMSIADRIVGECYGSHNWPDGEVFTSPDANTVNGEIFLDQRVMHDGVVMEDIYLKIQDGRIVDYSAKSGEEQLGTIIETDNGSHRLGEVAFGLNMGFDEVLSHPLFVEKVGGTLHVAIGRSYGDCYVEDENSKEGEVEIARLTEEGTFNESAQHVDLVVDFGPNGCGQMVKLDEIMVSAAKGNNWEVLD